MSGNVMHIFALNSIGAFLLSLGKLGITALTCAIAVFWLQVSHFSLLCHIAQH